MAGLLSAICSSNEAIKSTILFDLCSFLKGAYLKTFSSSAKDESKISEISEEEYNRMIEDLPSYSENCDRDLVTLWDTGTFFPGRRIVRKLKEVDIGNVSKEECCSKNYKKKGVMAPGVLWFFCGDHHKCVGFVVLDSAESCKIVSEIIITRFPIPPKNIIYDNGCNLEDYVLNRWPDYFKDTAFLIDEFHFKSHNNCAPTYDSGLHSTLICDVNTSLVEQKNSKIRHIKNTTPFMKCRTFMSKLINVVSNINED